MDHKFWILTLLTSKEYPKFKQFQYEWCMFLFMIMIFFSLFIPENFKHLGRVFSEWSTCQSIGSRGSCISLAFMSVFNFLLMIRGTNTLYSLFQYWGEYLLPSLPCIRHDGWMDGWMDGWFQNSSWSRVMSCYPHHYIHSFLAFSEILKTYEALQGETEYPQLNSVTANI